MDNRGNLLQVTREKRGTSKNDILNIFKILSLTELILDIYTELSYQNSVQHLLIF